MCVIVGGFKSSKLPLSKTDNDSDQPWIDGDGDTLDCTQRVQVQLVNGDRIGKVSRGGSERRDTKGGREV